jgi:hypothetical protein
METPAHSRLVPERAVPLPRIVSREQRERMAATRQAAAHLVAGLEEILCLLRPQPGQWDAADYPLVRQEHGRRMELLATLRMELEHEADQIERAQV